MNSYPSGAAWEWSQEVGLGPETSASYIARDSPPEPFPELLTPASPPPITAWTPPQPAASQFRECGAGVASPIPATARILISVLSKDGRGHSCPATFR